MRPQSFDDLINAFLFAVLGFMSFLFLFATVCTLDPAAGLLFTVAGDADLGDLPRLIVAFVHDVSGRQWTFTWVSQTPHTAAHIETQLHAQLAEPTALIWGLISRMNPNCRLKLRSAKLTASVYLY